MTQKVAIVIYSTLEGSGLAANYRAFGFARELLDAGDDVTIVFDGSGVEALADVIQPDSKLNGAWNHVSSALRGACGFCAKSHGVADALKAADIPFLDEDRGHASLRELLLEGRQIITF